MNIHVKNLHQRRGSALLSSLMMLIMICMLAAVMVDLGLMQGKKSRMQSAADSAALAAAMRVGNDNSDEARADAQVWAASFANLNLPGLGDVLVEDDIVFGTWDVANETFSDGGDAPNAVQVRVRRDGTNTEKVGTAFMRIFGKNEFGLTTSATAMMSASSAAEGMPLALRAPEFGSVDPVVTADNPGKDGPSFPANGEYFEVGEEVIVAIYGQGKRPPVHLTLNIDADGPGAAEADVKKVLKDTADPIEMQVGDQAYVFNEGTGSASYGEALDDRLDLDDDDPGRDIVMPVVEILEDSRDEDGQLVGEVRIADFVSVHLDEIVEVDVPDPDDPSKTITDRYLMGTITSKRAETSWGGATPSGAGGGNVIVAELVN
jgi:Flp pilus assembly protein TadG